MKLKKKKQKVKVKNVLLKILIMLFIVAVIGVFVYYFLTAEDEENSLTLLEKQWIEKNKQTLIDIEVPNNVDILGNSGEGVLFTFLNRLEETTELKFNKTPYNYPNKVTDDVLSIAILGNNDVLKETDLLIIEEDYVVLSLNEENINSDLELNNKKIGALSIDAEIVSSYFSSLGVSVQSYNTIGEVISGLTAKTISYAVVPRYTYMSGYETEENVFVNYSLGNLTNKYVLRLGDNERLNNILVKSLENWVEKDYQKDLENALMKFYEKNYVITELNKADFTKRVYKYGYVKEDAYNYNSNDNIYGVAGAYINTLANILNMDFEYIEYSNSNELVNALRTNALDIAFINFTYENTEDYLKTQSPFIERMAVIANEYLPINNKKGLKNSYLYLKNDNYLYDFVNTNYGNVKSLNDYDKSGLIVVDENTYAYEKTSNYADYKLLFVDDFDGNYHFVVKNDNEKLYSVFDFILANSSYEKYRSDSINELLSITKNKTNFKEIYVIVLLIVLLPIIVVFLSIIILKNAKKLRISKKENFLKYNDMLTNLKNRNYLNANIEIWDNTKVYPRTIIVIDLNNLKYVNDNYGHEEGNELIKKAAAVLINNQLEKSDIIRTDGNEFLIYLIGYSKNQIATYASKLSKELEKLPYGFGAALGYSIIEDEIKTIDDAINEANIEMRIDKEQNYR